MIEIPFTQENIQAEFAGKLLNVATVSSGKVCMIDEVSTENWWIENGVIRIPTEDGTAIINSLRVLNGKSFLYGQIEEGYNCDCVVFETQKMGEDFQVFISTCTSYEDKTIPRLIRSLKRVGIGGERIVVVSGGHKSNSQEEKGEYTYLQVEKDHLGLTAISALLRGDCDSTLKYVLLVHDTCEVTSDFSALAASVEVGLPFDFLDLIDNSRNQTEFGFWSSDFICRLKEKGYQIENTSTKSAANLLLRQANLVNSVASSRDLRKKDVYGTGSERRVVLYPEIGIKKYSSVSRQRGL
jgi:hypothetical protein